MHYLREILRLGLVCKLSQRLIARSLSLSNATVSKYLHGAARAGLRYEDTNDKMPGSRLSVYTEVEKQTLLPLPQERYVLRCWKTPKVGVDYHVEVDGHYYSVPEKLRGKKVDVAATDKTVEIFYDNQRVASHLYSDQKGRHSTIKEHMPLSHQAYALWSPEYFIDRAQAIGEHAAALFKAIFAAREIPLHGYRTCRGILRLVDVYPAPRVGKACLRALKFRGYSYRSVSAILKNGLDTREEKPLTDVGTYHENVRGKSYFNQSSDQEVQ
jgi:transposase